MAIASGIFGVNMIIRQRTDTDCALCCIAMLCGVNYDTALKAAGGDVSAGINARQAREIMHRLAVPYEAIATIELGEDWWPAIMPILAMTKALLSVKSINAPGENHMIYWTGCELIDPSGMERQEVMADIRPHRVILVKR